MRIGFIGAGNMGGAILRGALEKGIIDKSETAVFGVNKEKLQRTREELGVAVYDSIEKITADYDVLMLGCKPQQFEEVLPKVAQGILAAGCGTAGCGSETCSVKNKIIVSMAAGISIAKMEKVLGEKCKIIRVMPNTPAQVGEAMTSVSRNGNVTDDEFNAVFDIFSAIGRAAEVPEEQIHCVIGVSGSSTAYTYMYIDALAKAAVSNGMEYEQALTFAAQAVFGAAKMVLETGISPEQLCRNVCSPGGTTIEAVNLFKERDFDGFIAAGFQAAVDKSKLMSK